MTTYHFTIYFRDQDYMSDEMAERLYEAGCDDCLPCSSNGHAYARFSREAMTLEAAIASAVSDVRKANYQVGRVQLEDNDLDVLTYESAS